MMMPSKFWMRAEDYTYGVDLIFCRAAIYFMIEDREEGLRFLKKAY